VKFVRALEHLHQQHERELFQLDLPKQAFSRRGSHMSNHSGDGDVSKSLTVPTLDDLLLDNGALDSFTEENIKVLQRISEELEEKHQSQVEELQSSFAQQLEKALSAKVSSTCMAAFYIPSVDTSLL